ncbi:hypothetical protein [Mesorhizobium sp.]|uniref:hypothetical protein n=1 Tax=Mesorhizobium sp. TaxID=1871066 RepID=UPI00120AF6EE|nr:hypothetical protein [Mesorhizobium sp.]TIO36530.1 MAG: hypothetical protein E5X89_00500 [Mesorhizobium sp.]
MAIQAGKPISKIINGRLDQSLSEEREIDRRFGSQKNYRMLQLVSLAIERAEQVTGRSWLDDASTFDQALENIRQFLERVRPPSNNDGQRNPSAHYATASKAAADLWLSVHEASAPLDRLRHIRNDLRDIFPRAYVHRAEFEERLSLRYRELITQLDRPPLDAGEQAWMQFGKAQGALFAQAEREVAAAMIAEGKHFDEKEPF